MARPHLTEMNLYFYMHSIRDFELIDYLKTKKKERKLNSLILNLLRKHIAEERNALLNQLLESEKELGFLPSPIQNLGYLERDLIDSEELKKSILKIESELSSLKGILAVDSTSPGGV